MFIPCIQYIGFKVSPKNLQLMYTKYSHTKNFDFFLYMYIAMMTGYKTEKAYWNIFYEPFFFYKYIYSTSNVVVCQNTFYIRTLW